MKGGIHVVKKYNVTNHFKTEGKEIKIQYLKKLAQMIDNSLAANQNISQSITKN